MKLRVLKENTALLGLGRGVAEAVLERSDRQARRIGVGRREGAPAGDLDRPAAPPRRCSLTVREGKPRRELALPEPGQAVGASRAAVAGAAGAEVLPVGDRSLEHARDVRPPSLRPARTPRRSRSAR